MCWEKEKKPFYFFLKIICLVIYFARFWWLFYSKNSKLMKKYKISIAILCHFLNSCSNFSRIIILLYLISYRFHIDVFIYWYVSIMYVYELWIYSTTRWKQITWEFDFILVNLNLTKNLLIPWQESQGAYSFSESQWSDVYISLWSNPLILEIIISFFNY